MLLTIAAHDELDTCRASLVCPEPSVLSNPIRSLLIEQFLQSHIAIDTLRSHWWRHCSTPKGWQPNNLAAGMISAMHRRNCSRPIAVQTRCHRASLPRISSPDLVVSWPAALICSKSTPATVNVWQATLDSVSKVLCCSCTVVMSCPSSCKTTSSLLWMALAEDGTLQQAVSD